MATLELINIDKRFDKREIESPEEFYRDKIQPLKKGMQIKYIHKMSFWEDLKIILLTIWYIIKMIEVFKVNGTNKISTESALANSIRGYGWGQRDDAAIKGLLC